MIFGMRLDLKKLMESVIALSRAHGRCGRIFKKIKVARTGPPRTARTAASVRHSLANPAKYRVSYSNSSCTRSPH
jgi:hypothetical protein